MSRAAWEDMHVLVVDDSESMRGLQRAILSHMGFAKIEEAHDGSEGLAKLASDRPHLILVDRNMPGVDGIEFVRRARNAGCDAPMIMVTTECSHQSVVEAIRAGVDHYVVKPFTPDLLCQRIEEALAGPAAV